MQKPNEETPGEGAVEMTEAEVRALVEAWYDSFVTENS